MPVGHCDRGDIVVKPETFSWTFFTTRSRKTRPANPSADIDPEPTVGGVPRQPLAERGTYVKPETFSGSFFTTRSRKTRPANPSADITQSRLQAEPTSSHSPNVAPTSNPRLSPGLKPGVEAIGGCVHERRALKTRLSSGTSAGTFAVSAGPYRNYQAEAGTKNEPDTFFVPLQKKGWKIDPHVSNLKSHEILFREVQVHPLDG